MSFEKSCYDYPDYGNNSELDFNFLKPYMLQKKRSTTKNRRVYPPIGETYMERTSKPLMAVVFLLPFIIFYELGLLQLAQDFFNRGITEVDGLVVSFAWVHSMLKFVRFSDKMAWFATPGVVIVLLLALQFTSKKKNSVRISDIFPMALESMLLAIPLLVFGLLFNSISFQNNPDESLCAGLNSILLQSSELIQEGGRNYNDLLLSIITGIGAGIYEELIFRLVLICVLMLILQDFIGVPQKQATLCSIIITALLFSLHHHVYFLDGNITISQQFYLPIFIFRTLAGVYLAIVFAIRGYGIAAASHAFYNIFVSLLNFY